MMKTTKFIMLFASVLLLGLGTAKAQNPTFTVNWSGCNIQVSESYYELTYVIYDISLGTAVVGPIQIDYSQTTSSAIIEINNWDCNQSIDTKRYFFYVQVALIKDTNYCAGDVRSNILTCEELYDNIALNVSMDY